jgi:hypothetical protein
MSDESLRDALEEALATVEQGIARSTKPDREGFLMTTHIRQLLAAHPAEPARTGIDSSLHTCPGCGVKVIGHERCGDPTRPECSE